MSKKDLFTVYDNSPKIEQIISFLKNKKSKKLQLKGLVGSSFSFLLQSVFKKLEQPILLVLENKETAAYYLNDLEQMTSHQEVLFYPSSHRKPYQIEETDNANVLLRAEVLNSINTKKKSIIIVTYPEALFEKVITRKELNKSTLEIIVGDKISIDFVNEVLFDHEFKRVDFITEPGEFSVRGGILDVFSFSNDAPYRIEFFGNEIESIRSFDIETQLSLKQEKKISIIPNIENKIFQKSRENFLKYIPQDSILFIQNIEFLLNNLDKQFGRANEFFEKLPKETKHLAPQELFVNKDSFFEESLNFHTVEFSSPTVYKADMEIDFHTKSQPSFNKQFELLLNDLNNKYFDGYKNYLLCSNETQAKRFHDIFESLDEENHENIRKQYQTIVLPLFRGFVDQENKICCYTDHQIFERYHKFNLKSNSHKKQNINLKELTSLSIGDYVTHIDHGIGKFGGLQKIDKDGKTQESIKLVYADNDIVYVSIHSLHKISKYTGKDGTPPKIYKLGSNAWKTLKQKTKARVKNIAFNLIQLYAKRRLEKGFQFAPDSYLQNELESSFIYEDTPDQTKSTQEVKADMESSRPMDRLVCGDVGFGKTEVAIRAAFKAVDNGKQVAVLVPTTILAYQHHRTFTERLKDTAVSVGYINRFRSAKQKSETLKKLANGTLDIIIGTHQLVNKEVVFKDLGLLIIDEEQKFGVNVKDKLKTIAANVDTLTLTATPIPRTLQFSLMAARDLSVITTPPPNRYPVETSVIDFNEETIRDAVLYEIQRNGQVFFVNNRVENIKDIAGMIQRLVPDARIGIGHGQMDGKKLEDLMLAFINGEFDVLISTTIIESGLDVPNANTIFINNAHHFGLSDLHQMRGRVGRSNKKASCYLICPAYSSMTEEAKKRIKAIEEFSDLGSGFNIAMKDLEIRGAGDLLGGEQSGFINEIGFETYQKIMNEAIDELKENEFKDIYQNENNIETKEYVKDFQIDTDFEVLFPDQYINNITERLALYNELSIIKNEDELQAYQTNLIDRFGHLPKPTIDLLDSIRIKWISIQVGIEKLVMKKEQMIGYFISDQQSDYYNSKQFSNILEFAQKNGNLCKIKEKQTSNGLRLLITFDNIKSVKKALETIKLLIEGDLKDMSSIGNKVF